MRLKSRTSLTVESTIDNLLQNELSENSVRHCKEIIDRAWYQCEERNGGYHTTAQELYGLLNFLNDRILPAMRCHSHDLDSVRKWLDDYIDENLSEDTLAYVIEHRRISNPSVNLNKIGTM